LRTRAASPSRLVPRGKARRTRPDGEWRQRVRLPPSPPLPKKRSACAPQSLNRVSWAICGRRNSQRLSRALRRRSRTAGHTPKPCRSTRSRSAA
jgi:hypothetical protein